MKKLVVTILVSLVLSGCAKNKSQNDFIINSTEEEKETEVTLDDNDEYQLKNIEMGKKEEKDQQESAALNGSSCRPGCCRCGGRIRRITEKRGKGIMKEGVSGSSNLNPRHPLFNMFK